MKLRTFAAVVALGLNGWVGLAQARPLTKEPLVVDLVEGPLWDQSIPQWLEITPRRRLGVRGEVAISCDDERVSLTFLASALRFDWQVPRNPVGECSITDSKGRVARIEYRHRLENADDRAKKTWIVREGSCPEVHEYGECITLAELEARDAKRRSR